MRLIIAGNLKKNRSACAMIKRVFHQVQSSLDPEVDLLFYYQYDTRWDDGVDYIYYDSCIQVAIRQIKLPTARALKKDIIQALDDWQNQGLKLFKMTELNVTKSDK